LETLPMLWSTALAWLLLADAPATSPSTLVQLREEARQLVSSHCGTCHSATSPKALPGALKVYDVDRVDWTKRMSDAQVKKILQRFRGPVIPENEVDRVTAYVEAELASRKARTQ
jgi:mono/diheme cytochrome c family protein